MIDGLDCICCQVSNLHSININCEPVSGVAGTVNLILKQGSCTQEGYVKVKQFSALEGQPDTGVHYIIRSRTACSYIGSHVHRSSKQEQFSREQFTDWGLRKWLTNVLLKRSNKLATWTIHLLRMPIRH